jgi:hypothetical protein
MELECCANKEPNDDATEPYFADNDDGPTDIDDESSTIIASSHGSSVANRHNARRAKRRGVANDHNTDVMEQSNNIPWEAKRKSIDKVRDDLVEYIANNPARCGNNKKEIHICLKTFFEEQKPEPVPFVSKDTLSNFLSKQTKNPRFDTKQIDTFIAFMRDKEVVPSSQVSEIYPDIADAVNGTVTKRDVDHTPVGLLDDSLLRLQDDMVELGDMMDVDQDCGDTSFENASSAPEFKEPRPYDFVSDNEEGTFEEFQDEDMYYQTEDCESYMVLLDDDDHNVHDEEAEADEEENSDGNEPSVFEGKCGNDPRIGITMYDYEKFGHLAAGVRRYRKNGAS